MDFYVAFTRRKNEIEQSFDETKNSQKCLDQIATLLADVRNNRDNLTTHDLDKYETELAVLGDKCRQKPKKFAFKSKITAPAPKSQQKIPLPVQQPAQPRERFKDSGPGDNLDSSVVYCDDTLKTLHLSNISNSFIYLSNIEGPLYLTNIENSVIVAQCHQFRIHASHECDIYLGTDRPIIENCKGLRFGPAVLGPKWSQIDDFDWIRDTPSANWSQLPSAPPLETDWIKTAGGRAQWIGRLRKE